MNASSADEIAKLSTRLRLVRIPLIALVVMNSCLLWVVPPGKGRDRAAAVEKPEETVAREAPARVERQRPPRIPPVVSAGSHVGEDNHEDEPPSVTALDFMVADAAPPRVADAQANESLAAPPVEDALDETPSAPAPQEDSPPAEPPLQPLAAQPVCVVLENADASGTPVGYLVDGEERWLNAGQQHELPGAAAREIVFHRGGDFGDAAMVIEPGRYRFRATADGWILEAAPQP
jgi:hypothetical protein